jgi:hypothetical protein
LIVVIIVLKGWGDLEVVHVVEIVVVEIVVRDPGHDLDQGDVIMILVVVIVKGINLDL